jgi:asparagine synthase (glutamine-hydrolysing)
MCDAIAHRGPDGEGYFHDAAAVLGHRRLAIIDRAGGHQPMTNEDHTCWVVFNGEIYNHRALRRELEQRGHQFRTQSDTEVIIHAFEEFGSDCVERFHGMFAFAAYDQRTRQLLLARDRLGKKPLFYAVFDGVLYFGSEIKALKATPAWDGTLDTTRLESYLSLGYILAPHTIYRAVRKLEPGQWLRVRNGQVQVRTYWDVCQFDDWTGTRDEALDAVDAGLRASVHDRLESEVPLGAFLSGGIDSGLVVSCMTETLGSSVVTTTVGFAQRAHDETALAELTAARYSTCHYVHTITPELDDALEHIVRAFDEPFADASSLPTWYVSREARRHVTVALSGDGGDEAFGGYDFRYVPHAAEHGVRMALPRPLRTAVGSIGAAWPRDARMPRPLRLGTYLQNISREPADAYYADLCFLKPDRARRLLGLSGNGFRNTETYEAVTAPYRRCRSRSVVQRAEYADLKVYLPNDVLVKVDRMSMQHSLEVRCPLLDHKMVELAFRLPQRIKQAHRRGKHLLRCLARKRLPAEVVHARKHGFSAPIGAWVAGPFARRFEAEVLAPGAQIRGYVDVALVRRAFDAHRSGRADQSFMLWALWVLERWLANERAVSYQPHLGGTEIVA